MARRELQEEMRDSREAVNFLQRAIERRGGIVKLSTFSKGSVMVEWPEKEEKA